ncbi:MAG: hypothetical protein U1F43_31290 [Myxococcota bacterium]
MDWSPFEHHLTTRGTEIDQTATVGLPSFVRYFEHLRWLTMEDPRLGLVDLIHAGHFFVVRTQVVELLRRVGQSVPLRMTTRFESIGRSTAAVLHECTRTTDGALVARARVTGVWLGPTRKMVRLPDAFREFADGQLAALPLEPHPPELDDHAPLPDPQVVARPDTHATSFTAPHETVFAPLGVRTGPPAPNDPVIVERRFEHVHRLIVPPRDLDVFSHVNAATWLLYCEDARHLGAMAGDLGPTAGGAAPGAPVRCQHPRGWGVRAGWFYQREAVLGDALDVGVWSIGPRALGFAFLRAGAKGDPHHDDHGPLVTVRLDVAPGGRAVTEPA